jgi:RNA polymerase primary sigma factor
MSNTLTLTRKRENDDIPVRSTLIPGASTDPIRDYLQQIGTIPLLSAEEEIDLAKRIEAGLLAREKLEAATNLPASLIGELQFLVRDGSAANARFVCSNLKLVVSAAKRYARSRLPLMDLIQEGNLGLDRAVKKFDYTKGYKFSTYAMWWIRQAIGRGQSYNSGLIRLPVHTVEKIHLLRRASQELETTLGRRATETELAQQTQLSTEEIHQLLDADRELLSLHMPIGDDTGTELAEVIEDDNSPEIIDIVSMTIRHEELHKRVAALPDRQAKILGMKYGLTGGSPMTMEQIGAALGVSRQRARQIEQRALTTLRCPELRSDLTG